MNRERRGRPIESSERGEANFVRTVRRFDRERLDEQFADTVAPLLDGGSVTFTVSLCRVRPSRIGAKVVLGIIWVRKRRNRRDKSVGSDMERRWIGVFSLGAGEMEARPHPSAKRWRHAENGVGTAAFVTLNRVDDIVSRYREYANHRRIV